MVFTTGHERTYKKNYVRKDCGFTLIELIACIVIIGILAAVAGPSFFSNTAFAERGYIDEVAAAIRYGNSIAVGSGCDVQVTLNTNDYQVMQRAAAGTNCAVTGAFTLPVQRNDGTGPMSGNAPSGVTLSPLTQIVFDPQGSIAGTTPLTLTIGVHTITIEPNGLVTVQ